MEEILKAFSVGLLIRSAFTGAFFTLSYFVATCGLEAVPEAWKTEHFPKAVAVSLLAGFTIYSLHRSLVYPVSEWIVDAKCAQNFRRDKCPLIFQSTIARMQQRWESGNDEQNKKECIRHIATWADYAHFQCCAGLCMMFGALAGAVFSGGKHQPEWTMIILTLVLFVAGLISDWRLRSVQEKVLK
jgi:hypothetical protein